MISLELLRSVAPQTAVSVLAQYVLPLQLTCDHYEINTGLRLANFLAQIAHESGSFTTRSENLFYSAEGLNKVFKKYFPTVTCAQLYARQPHRIANRVYANRMGNGDEASGDGFRYRGRGLIQLTGKTNYTRFAKDLKISLDECVAYLETKDGAAASAGWFWDQNQLNLIADRGDITGTTRRINGGIHGLEDRMTRYDNCIRYLGINR